MLTTWTLDGLAYASLLHPNPPRTIPRLSHTCPISPRLILRSLRARQPSLSCMLANASVMASHHESRTSTQSRLIHPGLCPWRFANASPILHGHRDPSTLTQRITDLNARGPRDRKQECEFVRISGQGRKGLQWK